MIKITIFEIPVSHTGIYFMYLIKSIHKRYLQQ